MMYTVAWLKSAQDLLASIWINASNRQAIADAADAIDAQLRADPYAYSESRANKERVLLLPPLGVLFEVEDADSFVIVYAVWQIKT